MAIDQSSIRKRIGVVYIIRTLDRTPIYVGSTIDYIRRKSTHNPNKKKLQPRQPIQDYLRFNRIEYTITPVYQIDSFDKDYLLRKIHSIEQYWILYYLDTYKLLNKSHPLVIVSQIKNKYPWLTNRFILKQLFSIEQPPNNIL